MYRLLLIFTFAATLIGVGCNDPIAIVDGPGQSEIPIIFTDTFSVDTKTLLGENSSTYTLGINNNTYLLGALDDPIFGKSTSKVYVELDFLASTPNFDGVTLDSAILVMQYDPLRFYGDTTATYNIEVRQMTEQMSGDTIKSDKVWNTDPTIIGSRSIVPSRFDSLIISNHIEDGALDTIGPELRIKMDDTFAQGLIDADASNYANSTALLDFINGLEISASTDKGAMMGLSLDDVNNFAGANRLRVFFSTDTTKQVYDFSFRSRTASTFTHDITGSEVENYIADENHNGDDRAFYQGMSGVETEISFPTVSELKDRIINKAELIYYSVTDPNETNAINTPIDFATLTYINDDGDRTLTTDASLAISTGPYTAILGGNPILIDEVNGIYQTTVNLTSQFNTVFNNDNLSTNVTLTALQRSERSSRTVIFGSGSAEYKPVLRITYTNI